MSVISSLNCSALNEKLASAIQSDMTVRETPWLKDAVNFYGSSTMPIHRWFRYREGFSPAIFDKLNKHQSIFDPFCGCGTTLIEAKWRGVSAVGTDVNPLAIFVARVKTRNYSEKQIQDFKHNSLLVTQCRSSSPAPEMCLLPKLFQPEALDELLRLRRGLEFCKDIIIKDLLLLCWLNILESCSNVFKEGNGLKYRNKKRQRGKYETISDKVWIPQYFGPSIRTFVQQRWHDQCSSVSSDLEQLPERCSTSDIEILERSCLDSTLSDDLQTFDTSVFSPPYANRFDYFETFKIELWMGNFVRNPEQMKALRNRSMRNNLTVQTGEVKQRDYLEGFLDLMDDNASSVRMGIRETLRGYFDDIALLARNLRAVVKPGGRVLCVVGNSAYAGVLIPTDLLCSIIFREAGLNVESIEIARHLHVSSQQRSKMSSVLEPYMRESVITCVR